MFDGLKEKLDSFTQDAQEDVDDAIDAEVEDDPDADAVDGDGEDAPSGDRADGEPLAGESTGDGSDTDGGEAVEAPSEAVDSESEPESDEEDDDGRGLTKRAKLFATGKTVIDEDDLESHLEELEFALLGSDVEMEVAQEILAGVEENLVGETRRRLSSTGNLVRDALREALYDVISVGQFDFDERVRAAEKPFVIIFTGVNGVGKTTSIAKLARYFERRGLSTVLANGDTFRAGANEQLEQHARNLDKKIISHEQGSDPAAVIYDAVEYADANDVDVVLGDTAGRLHTSDGLMDQLAKIDRVIDPDMTLFVDEAVAGQDAVNRAREFDHASEIDGTILTKADADPQGGAAISIAHVTGKPILFLGTGQDYDDLERFEPERIVDELIGEE
ncbi:signal recognition particle-docking protein FtsY [Halobacteriales archaeon QH_2_65_14]|nr:MAG: signal recognition particle-docking protein FtsY [Halobacteriales archaeon QH_2_65_14]